jgi:two-component system sensor histidine kinase KdpD
VENLAALRETALRQVAEEVEAKRLRPDISDRLLALIEPQPTSQRIVRRAWRSAQRLGAELDVLWVSRHEPSATEMDQVSALRKLTSVLGAHLLVERGDSVAEVVVRVAEERGTTFVLMGVPQPRGPLARLLSPELPMELLARLSGVDVQLVAHRTNPVSERER